MPNRLLRYAPELDQWCKSNILLDALGSGQTFGKSLDDRRVRQFRGNHYNWTTPGCGTTSRGPCASAPGGWPGSPAASSRPGSRWASSNSRAIAIGRCCGEILFLGKGGTTRLQVATRQKFQEIETFGPTFGAESDG